MLSTTVLLLRLVNPKLQSCHTASSGKILILLTLPKKIGRVEKVSREEGKSESRASSNRRRETRETTTITTEGDF